MLAGPMLKMSMISDAAVSGSTAKNHFSCSRSTRPARRQRRTTLTAAAPAADAPHATARIWSASNSGTASTAAYGFGRLRK